MKIMLFTMINQYQGVLMKKNILLFFMLTLLWNFLFAEGTVTDNFINNSFDLQKEPSQKQRKKPLENKTFGIEVNPFRLSIIGGFSTFSGTISLFSIDRKAEIAFPVYMYLDDAFINYKSVTVDCHYRYFVKKIQKGPYLSTFVRFAHLYDSGPENKKSSINKLGFGVGLGCRVFTKSGFYWGFSLSTGLYPFSKSNVFVVPEDVDIGLFDPKDDSNVIIDIELLKFGWAF